MHEKWNTEWNEKDDKFKEIKSNTRAWKEINRCGKNETVTNRLGAGHILLTHGFLMEGLLVPECEMCRSHAMTVKHLSTDCANLASLSLRFFDVSNQSTLKQILGRNKVTEHNKLPQRKQEALKTYLQEDWSLNPVIHRLRFVQRL